MSCFKIRPSLVACLSSFTPYPRDHAAYMNMCVRSRCTSRQYTQDARTRTARTPDAQKEEECRKEMNITKEVSTKQKFRLLCFVSWVSRPKLYDAQRPIFRRFSGVSLLFVQSLVIRSREAAGNSALHWLTTDGITIFKSSEQQSTMKTRNTCR